MANSGLGSGLGSGYPPASRVLANQPASHALSTRSLGEKTLAAEGFVAKARYGSGHCEARGAEPEEAEEGPPVAVSGLLSGASFCTNSKAFAAGPWIEIRSPWNWIAKLISPSPELEDGP